MTLRDILREAGLRGASDVHLLSGRPPALRVNGYIELSPREALTPEAITALFAPLLTDDQKARFEQTHELCFSRNLEGLGFFRFNLSTTMGNPEAAIRLGMKEVPALESLGLPDTLIELVRRPHGLILVTGPTGVGKTTTLNALIGRVNAEERKKIITIEDPVEYVHPQRKSLVVQREIGLDAPDFNRAVIHALRQDPDMIVIGEMRDRETIASALTAAETGHLVLATLHTTGAVGTISRIVDVFEAQQQAQVRLQVATTLQAVLTQKLLPRADGEGRLLVYELFLVNLAARNLIRDGRANQITNVIQTGGAKGMRLMDQMIREAYEAGEITWDVAQANVKHRERLSR